MRRLVVGCAAACTVALACASMQAPPGGPKRTVPPGLVKATPESGAVNVKARSVELEFDAIVNDRTDLSAMFVLSPDEGASVRWHRERIEVRPRRGFKPGTAYSLTVMPGLADLNNNQTLTARTITFSTGPTIPAFAVTGRVFDWIAQRSAPGARIQVLRRSDSLPYVGVSDSLGMFTVGPLEEGDYRVRAMVDANRNRELDGNEAWDSTGVVVSRVSPFVEMRVVARDTIAPRILTVTARDTVTVVVSFDRLLNPAQPLGPQSFRVAAADSTIIPVARVTTQAQLIALQAARDSIARDSAGRRDSTARNPVRTPAPDTTAEARPSVPAPVRDVILQFDSTSALKIGATYHVSVTDARGLLGPPRSSYRTFTVPRPDTTRAAAPANSPRPRPPERP